MDILKLTKFLTALAAIISAIIDFLNHILPDPPEETEQRPNTASTQTQTKP